MIKKNPDTATIPVYDLRHIDAEAQHGLMVARFRDYLDQHYPHLRRPHRHSFYHLVLFTKGSGTHTIDFETFDVRAGQAYFMSPGQVHSWQFEGDVEGYVVHFQPSFFTAFLHNDRYLERFAFFSGRPERSVCQLPGSELGRVAGLFEDLLEEVRLGKTGAIDLVRLRLLEFFIRTDRVCGGDKDDAPAPQKSLLLRHFRQLIDEHFRELRLPREYAALLYVTPNHLNALCRDLLGTTAGDLIRDRVLLEAKRLLTHADLTVAAVADNLHFDDPSYFNRFFRKYVGSTPDEFRKQHLHL
ncbi:AraC family transcriptional regulator [Flaviaesturariibacter amylovorans]|uniref:Helix-turn-helix transcriptional regulator n=1 Tax=Flaviaesturariibacter amylovorans TaxID=1084520 RepID=A0ABP8GHW5_9BACT